MKNLFCATLLFLLLLPSFSVAAVPPHSKSAANSAKASPVSSDIIEKSDWDKVPQDVSSLLKQNLRKAMCKFEIADGRASASTLDGLLTLSADAKAIRFKNGNSWFSLFLDSMGRMGEMKKTGKPILSSEGEKLSLKRKGLTEWYVNHGRDLEHGLVLNEKPIGNGLLCFSFAIAGNLLPKQDGDNITFVGNEIMNYAGIKAWDATGANLVCSMSIDNGKLLWQVNDTAAVYPVTVDPTISFVKKVTASDLRSNAEFGTSVSLSGDLAIVGAGLDLAQGKIDAGAAYLFSKDKGGSDNWGQVARITASDADVGDIFGVSVSISDDLIIIGANEADGDAGAAYIFSKDKGGSDNWGEVAKITASDAEVNDDFGCSVSISGGLAIVGARWEDPDAKDKAGAAYVFSKDKGGPDNWGQVAKITASDAESGSRFGCSVSISSDLAIVGARKKDGNTSNHGAAYIFSKDEGGPGLWGQVTKITASDAQMSDEFGCSVSISGDLVIIGALNKDAVMNNAGAAYIFSKDKGGSDKWGEVTRVTASDAEEDAHFGHSVSISGDLAIVGANYEDAGEENAGAAYIFSKEEGGSNNWGQITKVTDSDAKKSDQFGKSVSISGGIAIVGTPYKEVGVKDSCGTADIFSITTAPDKMIVPVATQPSGTVVSIDSCCKNVCTKTEVEAQYQSVDMDSMLGSQLYGFNATVTSGKIAYFCFNSSSLGERKAGSVALFKLFTDKDSKNFTYSANKAPTEEGYFWITDEANSGQYLDPNMILTGGQSYTVNYSIKDNGEYDINTALGKITDPVMPGLSSGSSGCTLNPQATFSVEWLLLIMAPLLIHLRSRFKNSSR